MLKNREKMYQVYLTILSMALTWALTLAINQYFGLRVHILMSAFYSLILAVLVYLFDRNRKNTISYLLLIGIIPISGFIFWVRKINPTILWRNYISWCQLYNGTEELYEASFARFTIFLIALVGIILFYLFIKKQITKIILAAALAISILILGFHEIQVSKAVIGICIFYIMTVIVELYGIFNNRKAKRTEKKEGILYLVPVCLILAALPVILPSKPEPIQWSSVKYVYHNVKEQVDLWITDLNYYLGKSEDEFTISLTGYSDESSSLRSGNLTRDDRIALYVTNMNKNQPLYLSGSISDIYTGDRWEKSQQDIIPGEKSYLLDYMELIYGLSRQDIATLENEQFVERRVAKSVYHNIKTRTLFYPIKSSWISITKAKTDPSAQSSNIIFKKAVGKGTSYEFGFYELNLEGKAFQEMLREADSFSYDNESNDTINIDNVEWLEENYFTDKKAASVLKKPEIIKVMKDRAEMIKAQYTVLPESLPDRVTDLTVKLTKDYDTTYDKLKAIEAFLQEYSYTLKPGDVPEGEDFVDYFLFERQKGYCTSFASAMAVMGRCIGIPTRYVEGFVVTLKEKTDDRRFPVRNNQSHAWAEAYIEGVGWIPFETTPTYAGVRYVTWKEKRRAQESGSIDYRSYYGPKQMEEMMGQIPDGNRIPVENESRTKEIMVGLIIVLVTVFIVIACIILYYFLLRYQYKKEFDRADYNGKMYLLFLRILKLLRQDGFTMEQQETIRMLSQRVKEHYRYNTITFFHVADIFMRYRYAEELISKEEYEQVAVFHLGLVNKQKEEKSRLQVWMDEFLFLTRKSYR